MDYFCNVSDGIPPCTYLRRQIQDSRGRKPSYLSTSSDGQYIAILYLPRSSKSIRKSLFHMDRSISKAMKMKLDSQCFNDSIKCDNKAPLYTNYKSYTKFLLDNNKFDIYDEIEGFDKSHDSDSLIGNEYKPHFTNGKREIIDLNLVKYIDFNKNHNAYIVIYDTFFMNPISEIVLDDFLTHEDNSDSNSKIFHTFFIKFALGDSFILCFINNTLWIIHNNYISHKYCLKLRLASIMSNDIPLQLDTIDLVSILKNVNNKDIPKDDIPHHNISNDHDLVGSFIESNKFPLYQCNHESYIYEFIIHYETQFPIRALFCQLYSPHNNCDDCVHLKSIESLYPKIDFSNNVDLKCHTSAMITDCRYVYYDENNSVMDPDKIWVECSTGLELIGNLITMSDGQPILPTPTIELSNNVYKKEFFCKILIATIVSYKTNIMLVLSDLNRKTLGSIGIPFTNDPLTIRYSHNASYICCFSMHNLSLIKVQTDNENGKYVMDVVYLVNPSQTELVWDFIDVAFGGDIQCKWLYIVMDRGVNNTILCIYDVALLDKERITWAEESTKPYIELNLNTTLFPMCIQIVSVPCNNMLLLVPIHQRYVSVLTPEYVENWDNTATRNFMRFPLFSSNKEMLQLHYVWDDVKIEPVTKHTIIPTLTQPTFCYYRGCTGLDSHINYLCSLNTELNNIYNEHYFANPGLYSIWPSIESLLTIDDSTFADIKSPPLRRVRYYGLDCDNQFNVYHDILNGIKKVNISNSISDSVYDMANSLIDEIYNLYKKGSISNDNWSQSLVFCSINYITILAQMLDNMTIDKNLFRFDTFDDYDERLSKLREFWVERMENRGIALRKKCPSSSRFKSLSHPTTFKVLDEYFKSSGVVDKRIINKSGSVEKNVKIAKLPRRSINDNLKSSDIGLVNGSLLSDDLLSIIPERKLPLSILGNVSLDTKVDSMEALKRSTAEVALGIYYLKKELDDKNIRLPRNLRRLISFLTRASVAHHAYINRPHHN